MLRFNDFEGGRAFDISFMTWEEFRDIVLDPLGHVEGWTALAKMDCIIGGFDYAADRRYVSIRSYVSIAKS